MQRAIAASLALQPSDTVLEIGPGPGALTQHLVGEVERLILVELDDALAERLRRHFATDPSVDVIHGDILKFPLEDLTPHPETLKIVGNIPYNITTPILFALLERRPRPREVVLMVQREVANRLLAEPGGKEYGALAVGVQTVADVEHVLDVGRKAFRPVPDVESAVVRIVPHVPPRLAPADEAALRSLTRAAFGRRRKQFQRTLRDVYGLAPEQISQLQEQFNVDLRGRPETFSPQQFVLLARALPPLPGSAPHG